MRITKAHYNYGERMDLVKEIINELKSVAITTDKLKEILAWIREKNSEENRIYKTINRGD